MHFEWDDSEFEELLRREANQHRLYPNDRVWRNIRSEIHGYKRWHSLYISAFCVIVALTISTLLNNKPIYLQKLMAQQEDKETKAAIAEAATPSKNYFQLYSVESINEKTFGNTPNTVTALITNDNQIAIQEPSNIAAIANKDFLSKTTIDLTPVIRIPAHTNNATQELENDQATSTESNQAILPVTPTKQVAEEQENTDTYVKDFGFNLSYKAMKKNKWSFQYFIAPSVSYRKLNDQIVQDFSPFLNSTNPIQSVAARGASNTLIRNRPGMGIEAGIAFMYNASNRIRFKFGIQYNLRQYYIETYQSNNDFANVLLVDNNRVQQNLRINTRFNNKNGNYETEINNRIGQVSVPLGVQWDIIKSKNINFTAEATVQPSFTLTKNVYLLSTDYTNYVEGSNLMRRSNINTSIGFFASFPVGKNTIWQIGPQYRYQHLPTYTDKYPIKENLHDFGIRLGVIKSLGK